MLGVVALGVRLSLPEGDGGRVEKWGKSPRSAWKGGPGCHSSQEACLVAKGSFLSQPFSLGRCQRWKAGTAKGEGA